MNSSPLIIANKLSRTFGPVHALTQVDMTIDTGEVVAIMGRSGSGKSTLLHLLGLLDRPTDGSYLFADRDTAHLSDGERSRLRAEEIGFIFQAFHLIPQLDVLSNVALPFFYHPRPPRDPTGRARKCLARVGLDHRLDHLPSQLSGGELQRAAIARALVTGPRLILADEPTGNLDSETEAIVLDHLRTLRDEGITLIIITHDAEVAKACDRIITLQDGAVVP
jgi:putative ABC transport system ATP-binding protein